MKINVSRIITLLLLGFQTYAFAYSLDEKKFMVAQSLFFECWNYRKLNNSTANEDNSVRGRKCNCLSQNTTAALDGETIDLIFSGKKTLEAGALDRSVQLCKDNFEKYPASQELPNALKTFGPDSSTVFSGRPQRYTAFRQHIYTADMKYIRTVELENGKYLYDINVLPGRDLNTITDARAGKTYSLVRTYNNTANAALRNYEYLFFIPDLLGYLAVDSKRNLLASQVVSVNDGIVIETHYIRSQALICSALKEARSRAGSEMAISLFKEFLVAAIKSYAGASYGGGTFVGQTTSGRQISGTYTTYDNSWLGEHYSRGLEVIFSGGASLSKINAEMDRLECETR